MSYYEVRATCREDYSCCVRWSSLRTTNNQEENDVLLFSQQVMQDIFYRRDIIEVVLKL